MRAELEERSRPVFAESKADEARLLAADAKSLAKLSLVIGVASMAVSLVSLARLLWR
jgi:hypothetical protein